jgi:hypothetical protein
LWAYELDGSPVIRNSDHTFGPTPSPTELNVIAEELFTITTDLNKERLEGFLKKALEESNNN